METRYTVQTGGGNDWESSHMSCDTGKRNWNYRFTETNWDTVITPDMIFNFF